MATRGRDGGGGEKGLEKGGQKVQISNYKIHKYKSYNVQYEDYS